MWNIDVVNYIRNCNTSRIGSATDADIYCRKFIWLYCVALAASFSLPVLPLLPDITPTELRGKATKAWCCSEYFKKEKSTVTQEEPLLDPCSYDVHMNFPQLFWSAELNLHLCLTFQLQSPYEIH
jgi:hypothetical protein